MPTCIVSYDLVAPDKDYAKLTGYLKSHTNWWHYLGSTWVVVTDLTAAQLRDDIAEHSDSNDRVLVVNSSGTGAWAGFPDKSNEWLMANP